jgi:IS5 family transposase
MLLLFDFIFSLFSSNDACPQNKNNSMHNFTTHSSFIILFYIYILKMKQYTPQVKHSILTHYTSPANHDTLSTILSLHNISVTRRTVERWKNIWDGSIESLQHKEVKGRPRVLSKAEVRRHVGAPIRNANRSSRIIHYTSLLPQVRAVTSKNISLPTLKRYGKKELEAKQKKGKKRTADESKYI